MGSGSPPSQQISGFTPQMLPPNYAFNRQFYNEILPAWVNYAAPTYQEAGGRLGRKASPTQQAAMMAAQGWMMSPLNREGQQFVHGVLGNLGSTGGAIDQIYAPGSADYALERFLAPSFINPSAAGPRMPNPMNLGGGGPYFGWSPYQMFPQGRGGAGSGTGLFTPPGAGQPNGRGAQG